MPISPATPQTNTEEVFLPIPQLRLQMERLPEIKHRDLVEESSQMHRVLYPAVQSVITKQLHKVAEAFTSTMEILA